MRILSFCDYFSILVTCIFSLDYLCKNNVTKHSVKFCTVILNALISCCETTVVLFRKNPKAFFLFVLNDYLKCISLCQHIHLTALITLGVLLHNPCYFWVVLTGLQDVNPSKREQCIMGK